MLQVSFFCLNVIYVPHKLMIFSKKGLKLMKEEIVIMLLQLSSPLWLSLSFLKVITKRCLVISIFDFRWKSLSYVTLVKQVYMIRIYHGRDYIAEQRQPQLTSQLVLLSLVSIAFMYRGIVNFKNNILWLLWHNKNLWISPPWRWSLKVNPTNTQCNENCRQMITMYLYI